MSKLPLTGSSTVGPFFSIGLLTKDMVHPVLASPETPGEHIRIEGRVLDGDGAPVIDALLEIWQANASGHYNHPAAQTTGTLDPDFSGYGRTGTAKDGSFWFETVKPGAVPFDDNTLQAPHLNLTIFSRGLLNHLATRLYFEDEAATATDPVLQLVPAERRATLVARKDPKATEEGKAVYRFDIIMQGEGETAFFNL
ncbi:MAG: protocatechuate 3,4-dioxygenase subunit alpha [Chloroflexi bacterium]|nr:protocatechuate 3,4-dioxygenase subunit alpha [Chloroflexota bacterium]OJV94189.1 MAG: protocatechuate 3,4-dioxygenase subunit alpha [Chloroflexi bacterium 54-19]